MVPLVLALVLAQADIPPEARVTPQPQPPAAPSVWTRAALATGGGVLAGAASLGLALALTGQNPAFDSTFATTALSSILVTGVAFTVHEALGGRGEVTLALLMAAVVMAGSMAVASAVDSSRPNAAILTTAIGSLPAAAVAVLGLEGTTPLKRSSVRVAVGPTGVYGTF